ncbi:MAG TPA: BTAD domain-containing putative transcriptional regulator [Candidatus Limnocylindria bacterium]|jgi:DNA-binding SARP family transcriptional activator|nr:BTAD domain-containing putative transcriptional regulator [Candidatus Limnocylindria bacterium]
MAFRAYLAGRVCVESGDVLIGESELGGRQSRLLLCYLLRADGRPVPKDELAELLWPVESPPSWEISVAALVSKLRAILRPALPGDSIDGALGCYQLRLPVGAWVDIAAAGANLYQAEGALLRADFAAAGPHAMIASTIARRPFLPEEHGPWVERTRRDLHLQRVRALEIFDEVLLDARDFGRAIDVAREIVELEPYRETAHQLLMRAHASAGNRAEAVLAYEQCRRLLASELGVDPSPPTEAVYLKILRS